MRWDYDWISVGGGTAGEVGAGMAASLGARAAVVEEDRLGGECLWHGCMPSKTLIHLANRAYQCGRGAELGIGGPPPTIDFARLMEAVRGVSRRIYDEMAGPTAMARFSVETRRGRARFLDRHTIEVDDGSGAVTRLTSRVFLIATGSTARVPDIPGLCDVPYLTDQSLFSLSQQPRRLLVLGAGALGLEMGQALGRLGTRVHLVDPSPRVLPHDDPEHVAMLLEWLRAEGLDLQLGAEVRALASRRGAIVARIAGGAGGDGGERELEVDAVLVATGRRPAVEGLGLEAAGVACDAAGIRVNARGRTTTRNIFAAGDVTGRGRFTHMAENMAKAAVATAILKVPTASDRAGLCWCTFTSPEIGQLGPTQDELDARGVSYEVHRVPFSLIDRARTDFEARGQMKVLASKWRGRILGVSIVGARAGDMLCEWALARRNRLAMRHIADTIHPYPTMVWGVRRAADQWYVRRRPVGLLRLLGRLFGYQGVVNDLGKDGTAI